MMEPVARLMVPCEDARPRKGPSSKMDLFGIIGTVHAPADAFPVSLSFSVYLSLANGHGQGYGRIVVTEEQTENEVYSGDAHPFDFGHDPIAIVGCVIRIPSCPLPNPGVYVIRFMYNDLVEVGKCTIIVREGP